MFSILPGSLEHYYETTMLFMESFLHIMRAACPHRSVGATVISDGTEQMRIGGVNHQMCDHVMLVECGAAAVWDWETKRPATLVV